LGVLPVHDSEEIFYLSWNSCGHTHVFPPYQFSIYCVSSLVNFLSNTECTFSCRKNQEIIEIKKHEMYEKYVMECISVYGNYGDEELIFFSV
jgi:hypothetical protein